jgi:hypothetical protein
VVLSSTKGVPTAVLLYIAARDHWIVKTLSELECKMDNSTHLIQRVVNERVSTMSLPDNIVLHMDTLDDLHNLEDTLVDEKLRDQLVM